ncbi:hypothetical protein [Elizabethkingia sp. JS20170427COW]|uniref:hypothetical protein n=1 Tax=Elizabethkingia sp. JS20170427COW TaxID=2583851 RepID=UPI0011105C77|nr:hypothetical protein [Elizabethkingia sp. JS20170427COW]QCX53142.1 hypothetical protein FGE20_05065 [Elizabethkingia sp. JS20170427COW]
MKIDLDQLDKKTPYQVPENFFQEMQSEVFEKIKKEPQAKFISLKQIWLVAASLVLIASLTTLFMMNRTPTSNTSSSFVVDNNKVEKTILPTEDSTSPSLVQNNYTSVKKQNIEVKPHQPEIEKEERHYRRTKVPNASFSNNNLAEEARFENALNKLNSQELAEQSRKIDYDPYIDLY